MVAVVGIGISATRFPAVLTETHCVTVMRDFLLSQALLKSAAAANAAAASIYR